MTDFSEYPESLSERRGEQDKSPKSWTVRDLLIKLLREYDSGKRVPDHIIVFLGTHTEGGCAKTTFIQAGSFNAFEQVGLFEYAKSDFLRSAED